MHQIMRDVQEITVTDDQTIAFKLAEPNVAFTGIYDNGDFAKTSSGWRRYAGVGFLPSSDRKQVHINWKAGMQGSQLSW